MPQYIQFETEDGESILVEVERDEIQPAPGVAKAGIFPKKATENVAKAQTAFDDAVKRVVRENVRSLTSALQKLVDPPDEVELTFGLKATGEAGNIAIAKVGGEATLELKLVWKSPRKAQASDETPRADADQPMP